MQTIILPTLRPPILRVLHEAHPGIARMKAMARSHVWWPGIDSDIEDTVREFQQCHRTRNASPALALVLAHHSVATLTPRLRNSPFQPLPCRSRCSLQVARSVWSNEDNNRRSNLQCLAQCLCKIWPPSPNSQRRTAFPVCGV